MTQEQWKAIQTHDPSYDGKFYFAVKSSRVICKPSCRARNPLPENVLIFPDLSAAIQAGYHPCAHCRPDLVKWLGAKGELAARARAYIQSHYTEKFSLDQMAEALFVNKIYLSKCFKQITGDTLLHYHNQTRCERARALLLGTELPMEVIGDRVGFATPSHFARVFRSLYGCSPTEYKRTFLKSLQ